MCVCCMAFPVTVNTHCVRLCVACGSYGHAQGGDTLKNEADLHRLQSDTESGPAGPACGDCYGAGKGDECCNSCLQVRLAYQRKGWSFDPKTIKQVCCRGLHTHIHMWTFVRHVGVLTRALLP